MHTNSHKTMLPSLANLDPTPISLQELVDGLPTLILLMNKMPINIHMSAKFSLEAYKTISSFIILGNTFELSLQDTSFKNLLRGHFSKDLFQ